MKSMFSDEHYTAYDVNKMHMPRKYTLFPVNTTNNPQFKEVHQSRIKLQQTIYLRINFRFAGESTLVYGLSDPNYFKYDTQTDICD